MEHIAFDTIYTVKFLVALHKLMAKAHTARFPSTSLIQELAERRIVWLLKK